MPKLSLIVCTLGRTKELQRLFLSLGEQTSTSFEVIVVDQNPPGALDDLIAEISKTIELRHLRASKGLSHARNVGLAHVRGDILAFPDDDCWYPKDLVANALAFFEAHTDIDILTIPTRDENGLLSNGKFLQTSSLVSRRDVWRAGNSNGLFVRASLTAKIGGFDENLGVGSSTPFGAGEETDFLLRALESGARVFFETGLYAHHPNVDLVLDGKTMARAALYARGFGRILRLHRFPAAYALFRAARSLGAAALALLRIQPSQARYKALWAFGTLSGYFHAPCDKVRAID
jgi:glycosyltransferase involved in cell wall biosynthesis